ncbi:MAG: type I methionyl aminopeptidase [Chlorobi bacterium]|nr:type I methionyl aminopeptidase [Chlorobiota bacterium]
MIQYKTKEEIEKIRKAALLVSKTLGMLAKEIKPGVTGLQLDKLAEEFIRDHGAKPGFLGLYGFPNTLCISPNEQVVHGIPTDRPFEEGDIVSIDCGVLLDGYYGDQAYTFTVGEVKPEVQKLLDITKESLYRGIAKMKRGNRVGHIGHAIQNHVEPHGYGVVRELVGHGLGRTMHEDPQVPNYGRPGSGKKLKDGLVLAIEPMINMGTHRIIQYPDGWTIKTADGLPSAHFEHDVALINGKPEILSTFYYIYEALGLPLGEEDEFRRNPDKWKM